MGDLKKVCGCLEQHKFEGLKKNFFEELLRNFSVILGGSFIIKTAFSTIFSIFCQNLPRNQSIHLT